MPEVSRSSRWQRSTRCVGPGLAGEADDRVGVLVAGGVAEQARGLVEHEQALVLVDDRRQGRGRAVGREALHVEAQQLAALEQAARLEPPAVTLDLAGLDRALHGRPRPAGEAGREVGVEAPPRVLGGDPQGAEGPVGGGLSGHGRLGGLQHGSGRAAARRGRLARAGGGGWARPFGSAPRPGRGRRPPRPRSAAGPLRRGAAGLRPPGEAPRASFLFWGWLCRDRCRLGAALAPVRPRAFAPVRLRAFAPVWLGCCAGGAFALWSLLRRLSSRVRRMPGVSDPQAPGQGARGAPWIPRQGGPAGRLRAAHGSAARQPAMAPLWKPPMGGATRCSLWAMR
jgi:hypothetical protein